MRNNNYFKRKKGFISWAGVWWRAAVPNGRVIRPRMANRRVPPRGRIHAPRVRPGPGAGRLGGRCPGGRGGPRGPTVGGPGRTPATKSGGEAGGAARKGGPPRVGRGGVGAFPDARGGRGGAFWGNRDLRGSGGAGPGGGEGKAGAPARATPRDKGGGGERKHGIFKGGSEGAEAHGTAEKTRLGRGTHPNNVPNALSDLRCFPKKKR